MGWMATSDLPAASSSTPSGLNYSTSGPSVMANVSVSDGCLIVRFEEMEFLPWDNPDNIVTAEVENIARRVKENLSPIFFLIGGPANVINTLVFYKQGLKERVNLCLFALSLADLLYLIQTIFISGEKMHLQFLTNERFGPVMRFLVNNSLVGFIGFSFVSQILSAVIASERCLCVLSPLRSQNLLQTSTMAVIVAAVYVVVVGLYFLVTLRYRIACIFDVSSGSVMYTAVAGEFYKKHEKLINYLDGFMYGAGIPTVTVTVVTITTIITAVKIREAAAWRAGTSSASGHSSSSSSSISPQELALTKMLIGISVLFIVCVFPNALFRFVWLFMPEMNIGRRYHNFFMSGLWILEAITYVNSSLNFFVYYTIGSRYRQTFWALVGKKKQDKVGKEKTTVTAA